MCRSFALLSLRSPSPRVARHALAPVSRARSSLPELSFLSVLFPFRRMPGISPPPSDAGARGVVCTGGSARLLMHYYSAPHSCLSMILYAAFRREYSSAHPPARRSLSGCVCCVGSLRRRCRVALRRANAAPAIYRVLRRPIILSRSTTSRGTHDCGSFFGDFPGEATKTHAANENAGNGRRCRSRSECFFPRMFFFRRSRVIAIEPLVLSQLT